ncbi:MAG: hypothetical protein FWD45_04275 [Coriobacteriia bacterium]|nr:hypothetical protein [Coriobacteriia bacterium]
MGETDKLFEFFQSNQENLVNEYDGKFIVIHDFKVVESFENGLDAYLYGKEHFDAGTFIVQKCIPGEDAYTIKVSTLGMICT